jgi:hypothetical protein
MPCSDEPASPAGVKLCLMGIYGMTVLVVCTWVIGDAA